MSNLYYQNYNFIDFNSQIATSISSNSHNKSSLNQKNSKLLKQKRGRNKNDKHEYDSINQYYIEDYFDCYNNYDDYDYSQKSSSLYHKDNIDFEKLKEDLMPKKNI